LLLKLAFHSFEGDEITSRIIEKRPQALNFYRKDSLTMAGRKKQRENTNGATVGYEAQLWQMADALRGSMDAAEYKHVVLEMSLWVPSEVWWAYLKAQALRNDLSEDKGFSERNIKRMMAFYREYGDLQPAAAKVPQPVAQLTRAERVPQAGAQFADSIQWTTPWFHHVLLVEKARSWSLASGCMQQVLAHVSMSWNQLGEWQSREQRGF
jgi:hypothetical protein